MLDMNFTGIESLTYIFALPVVAHLIVFFLIKVVTRDYD